MIKLNIYENKLVEYPFDETKPYIEVTEEQFFQIQNGQLKYKNGELVDNTSNISALVRIKELKQQIKKYKEDVEQVELFGMERADYEEKKAQCVQIIEELRALEAQLKGE